MVAKKARLAALLMTVVAGAGMLGTASAQEFALTATTTAGCAGGIEIPVSGNLSLLDAAGVPAMNVEASVGEGTPVVAQSDIEGNYTLNIDIPSGVDTSGADVIVDVVARDPAFGSALASAHLAVDAYCALTVGTSSAAEGSSVELQDPGEFPDSLLNAILGVDDIFVVDADDMTDGSGTVTATGINCPGDCADEFLGGSDVTVTAAADAGSVFAGWDSFNYLVKSVRGDGTGVVTGEAEEVESVCTGQAAACTFTITGDTLTSVVTADDSDPVTVPVTAFFEPANETFAVAIDAGSGSIGSSIGGIDCPTTCGAVISHGSEVTFTATPAAGYELAGWTGACAGSATNECVLVADDDKDLGAIFQAVE